MGIVRDFYRVPFLLTIYKYNVLVILHLFVTSSPSLDIAHRRLGTTGAVLP